MNALTARLASFDRTLLGASGALLIAGLLFSLAASPAATARIDVSDAFHFSWRHAAFAAAGLLVFAGAAQFSPKGVRRLSLLIFLLCIVMMALVLVFGAETKGAQRWLQIGFLSVQPSEFLKPAFIVLAAWMLATKMREPDFPGLRATLALYGVAAILLIAQPDVGQTALLTLCLGVLLFSSGVSWLWLLGGVLFAGVGGYVLYLIEPHVHNRVNDFIATGGGYQVTKAIGAIEAGGPLGVGPGEGEYKRVLPDSHADFIYAVSAEEFGLLASVGLIGLYTLIGWRGLSRAARLADPFAQLAAAGLIALFCLQAAIHIAVNLALMPAKGMTLPLVSYGGSSMLASALTLGFALALLRRKPGAYIYEGAR
jgi:cell division protein FtsW